mgnify:CR=1 FL=1
MTIVEVADHAGDAGDERKENGARHRSTRVGDDGDGNVPLMAQPHGILAGVGNGGQSRIAHQNGILSRRKAVPDSLPRGLRGGKSELLAEYMKNGGLPYITNFAGDSEKIDIRDRLCEARNKRAIPITRFNTGLMPINSVFNFV